MHRDNRFGVPFDWHQSGETAILANSTRPATSTIKPATRHEPLHVVGFYISVLAPDWLGAWCCAPQGSRNRAHPFIRKAADPRQPHCFSSMRLWYQEVTRPAYFQHARTRLACRVCFTARNHRQSGLTRSLCLSSATAVNPGPRQHQGRHQLAAMLMIIPRLDITADGDP